MSFKWKVLIAGDAELENDILTNEIIIQAVIDERQKEEEINDEEKDGKISCTKERNALQLAASYTGQQNKSTAVDP